MAYDLTGGSIEGSARLDLGQYNSVSGALRSKASSKTSVVKTTGGIMLRVDSGQTSYVLGAEFGTTPNGIDLQIESGIGQSGTASLRKEGDGTVALTGSSSYTGATTIAGGTLLVNGSLANTAVTVQSGGTLGGTGTLGGSVTVQGVLAPGSLGIGTLTINNAVALSGTTRLQVQRSGSILSSDRVAGATSIVAGGTLEVEAVGDALVAGDSFTLFNVQPTGSFASVKLPGLAAGLGWQATQNNRVITVVAIGAQAIASFTPVADQVFAPGKTVSIGVPTASSGLPVVVSVKSGPATVSGGTVTLLGAGTVVLAANQPGNGTYGAAAEVTTSFVVAKGPQSITFAAIPSQPFTASPLAWSRARAAASPWPSSWCQALHGCRAASWC